MSEATGVWPLSLSVRRCGAGWVSPDGERYLRCNRLIWPWQPVVYPWNPEAPSCPEHHVCHHREQEAMWREEEGEGWTRWLSCSHSTHPNANDR